MAKSLIRETGGAGDQTQDPWVQVTGQSRATAFSLLVYHGPRLRVSSDRLEEQGIKLRTPAYMVTG